MIQAILHGIGAYRDGERIGPAVWPHHDLICILRGEAEFTVNGRKWTCHPDSALLIPPRHSFQGVAGECGCVTWVQHFRADNKASQNSGLNLPSGPKLWHGAIAWDWPKTLMRRARELQTGPGSASAAQLARILWLLLHAFEEHPSSLAGKYPDPAAEKLLAVIRWVEAHSHPLPSVSALADRAGYSVSHFRERFRSQYRRSLGAYLRDLRMREAERLLRESNLPIKEISAQLGYSDPVAFHRAFVRHQGVTPARFRSQLPKIV